MKATRDNRPHASIHPRRFMLSPLPLNLYPLPFTASQPPQEFVRDVETLTIIWHSTPSPTPGHSTSLEVLSPLPDLLVLEPSSCHYLLLLPRNPHIARAQMAQNLARHFFLPFSSCSSSVRSRQPEALRA